MTGFIEELFLQYSKLPDIQQRMDFAFKMPRLLSKKTVLTLMESIPQSEDADSPWSRLSELDYLRNTLAMYPENYRIGLGPIEQIMNSNLSPREIIERCKSPELQVLISTLYLRRLADYARNIVRTKPSETSAWISLFVTETVLARDDTEDYNSDVDVDVDVDVVLSNLAVALYSNLHELDESIFCKSIELAMIFVERVKHQNDSHALGKLYHSIGSMYSDIWMYPGLPDDSKSVNLNDWIKRSRKKVGTFSVLGVRGCMPEPIESLLISIKWYQHALIFRNGYLKGLTYKAIAQALDFLDVVLHQPIDNNSLIKSLVLAHELIEKHPDATSHLQVIDSIAERKNIKIDLLPILTSPDDADLIKEIQACYEPKDSTGIASERSIAGHEDAIHDLLRVLRHHLPFVLYLRNFDYANEIHTLGQNFTLKTDRKITYVIPQITYSLVDHKILDLFEEGVFAICDPNIAFTSRLTLIPMLSLKNEGWLMIVKRLMQRCDRIVMLLDEITPGVQSELDLIMSIGAIQRTLIVTGHKFRTNEDQLPNWIPKDFPYIVDWIDFGFDESYHNIQHKAHGIMQQYLLQYVRVDVKPVLAKWLARN